MAVSSRVHTPTSILHEKLQFLKRLIILVFHLASLSLAVYFRPADVDAVLLQWPVEITDAVRTAAECITVLGVLNYILVQLGGEMINVGPLSFLKQLVGLDFPFFLFFAFDAAASTGNVLPLGRAKTLSPSR